MCFLALPLSLLGQSKRVPIDNSISSLDPRLHQDFQKSACYQEFRDVYTKAVNNGSSDRGIEEQSIVNAAHYVNKSSSLNHFHTIHSLAKYKYPEITQEQTQMLIRKGFQSGTFCDHWLFSTRYDKQQVSQYVKKEFGKYLEHERGRVPALSDSEIPKKELKDEMNRELQYDATPVSAMRKN